MMELCRYVWSWLSQLILSIGRNDIEAAEEALENGSNVNRTFFTDLTQERLYVSNPFGHGWARRSL